MPDTEQFQRDVLFIVSVVLVIIFLFPPAENIPDDDDYPFIPQ